MNVQDDPVLRDLSTWKRVSRVLWLLFTGIITIPLTLFMAGGAIGESDVNFPAPEYFWLLGIWLIGALLFFFNKTYWIGLIVAFLPVGYFLSLFILSNYFM